MPNWLTKLFAKNIPLADPGVLDDDRTELEKGEDIKFDELVATAAPVNWKPLDLAKLPDWPLMSQNGSSSCFPHDAEVLMQDFSYKPISEVRTGDQVITHEGRIRRVTETFQRKWQGKTKKIFLRGDYQPIEATLEHPFWAIKRRSGIKSGLKITLKDPKGIPSFVKMGDLEKGDWVGLPLNNEVVRDTTIYDFENDPEFLWVLGLYLAEGSSGKYYVSFSLHQKETDFVERIKKAMGKYDTNVTCSIKNSDLGMQATIQGQRWVEVFEELGNKYCDKKQINKRLMFLSPELQMNIVNGFIDGDGYVNKDRDRTIMVSTSLRLLTQIKTILLRNKTYSSLQKRKEREDRKPVWVLEFSKTSNSFIKDKWCFVPITEVEISTNFHGGHVYNIEVEEDNSYVVRNVGVHNCVAMTKALMSSILYSVRSGVFMLFSPKWIYNFRKNKPQGGMAGYDVFDIESKIGLIPEAMLPSQDLTETQINNFTAQPWQKEVGKALRMSDQKVILPIKDIETATSVMQVTNKPIMVWFKFYYDEWVNEPKVLRPNPPLHHSVTFIPPRITGQNSYGIYRGRKSIVIQDSWGNVANTYNGKRIISENFFKERNTFVAYSMRFLFDSETTPKPKYDGVTIISLQRCLQHAGFFPLNISLVENMGPITRKSVTQFQSQYGLAQTGTLTPQTIAKLRELYP